MGNIYEDDFGDELLELIKKKNKKLYNDLEKDKVYLNWDNSINLFKNEEKGYGVVKIKDYDDNNLGFIKFNVKVNWDIYGWYPEGVIKINKLIYKPKSNNKNGRTKNKPI